MGRLGLGQRLNIWLSLSSHCSSLLYQGPRGIEVMRARLCCSGPKASSAVLREGEEIKGVKKAAHQGMRLNFSLCPTALSSLPAPEQGLGQVLCRRSSESLWTHSFPNIVQTGSGLKG